MTTDHADQTAVDVVCDLAQQIGFANVTVTNADHHDRVIAYTSQLAHIVSNSYCKSETINQKEGFCFRDKEQEFQQAHSFLYEGFRQVENKNS